MFTRKKLIFKEFCLKKLNFNSKRWRKFMCSFILEMKITLFFIMSIRNKSVSVTLTNSVFKSKYNEFKLKLKFRTKFNKLTKTYRVFQFHTTI